MILGKACDLIDYHQKNKKLIVTTTPTKKEQSTSIKSVSSHNNAQEDFVVENLLTDVTPSKSSFKLTTKNQVGSHREIIVADLDNSLDMTEIPLSPLTPRTIEATNKELRQSAVVLDTKIQTLFAKKGSFF